jgi:hypothetical protein
MRPPLFCSRADGDGVVEDRGWKIENRNFPATHSNALHALLERLKHSSHARQRVGLGNCRSNCDCSSRAHGHADYVARATTPKIAQDPRSHRFKSAPAFRKIQRKDATEGIVPSAFRPLPASASRFPTATRVYILAACQYRSLAPAKCVSGSRRRGRRANPKRK